MSGLKKSTQLTQPFKFIRKKQLQFILRAEISSRPACSPRISLMECYSLTTPDLIGWFLWIFIWSCVMNNSNLILTAIHHTQKVRWKYRTLGWHCTFPYYARTKIFTLNYLCIWETFQRYINSWQPFFWSWKNVLIFVLFFRDHERHCRLKSTRNQNFIFEMGIDIWIGVALRISIITSTVSISNRLNK